MMQSSQPNIVTRSRHFRNHSSLRDEHPLFSIVSDDGHTSRPTPSVVSTGRRTSTSNTRLTVSRPSTSASGRKSGPSVLSTILGSNDDETIVCAIGEARGVSPLVGIALVNITRGEAILSQICDNQSYVKSIHKLQMANTSRIVFMSTSCPPAKDNVLFTLVSDLIPDARVELLDRPAWSESDGLEYIQKLAIDSDIDPIKVAVNGKYYCVSSFAAAMRYIEQTFTVTFAPHSLRIRYRPSEDTMMIDISVLQSLEIVQNIGNPKSKNCLFGLLNQTLTPMGSRILRANILQPPTKYDTFIGPRYEAVEELTKEEETFHDIRTALEAFTDIERVLTKMITLRETHTQAQAEEHINHILVIKKFLEAIPQLHRALSSCTSPLLLKIRDICHPATLTPILLNIETIIEEDATIMSSVLDMRNARAFAVKAGISGMLDVARQAYKELTEEVHTHVEEVEKETGVQLTLKYDNVRRYWFRLKGVNGDARAINAIFINVVKKRSGIECQTMPLIKLNRRLSETFDEIVARSDFVIRDLITMLRRSAAELFRVSESVALIDMVASFAHLSIIRDYTRPEFAGAFALKAARHPVIDKILFDEYVPNDYYANEQNRFQIVTGCNMAGKSTYIKAAALLQIMAQVGCFVPAAYASFAIIHNIFARISLSDNMEANLSTFSVEMREMAFILRNVDDKSLVIIDELGRGTSTRDGLAIAIAISEALIQSKALVWFATHFVDLARVLNDRSGVFCLHLASEKIVSDEGVPQLAMLHKATEGTVDATEHYGIDLARSLGFPEDFTKRAEEVANQIRQRREQNRKGFDAQRVLARRKLVLNLYESLKQAAEHGNDDILPGYLMKLQEEFITRMNELTASSSLN